MAWTQAAVAARRQACFIRVGWAQGGWAREEGTIGSSRLEAEEDAMPGAAMWDTTMGWLIVPPVQAAAGGRVLEAGMEAGIASWMPAGLEATMTFLLRIHVVGAAGAGAGDTRA